MKPGTQIRDGWLRVVGIPLFGLGIPHATDLLRGVQPDEPRYWLGHAWFLLVAWLIWHGNRALLFMQRDHVDWFGHPLRKLLLLAAAVMLGTVPVTVAMLCAWYIWAG